MTIAPASETTARRRALPRLPGPGRAGPTFSRRLARIVTSVCSLCFVAALWELAVANDLLDPRLFPAPSAVFQAGVDLWRSGVLAEHIYWSVRRAVIGFTLGTFLGVAVGLLTGKLTVFRIVLEPILQVIRPIPGIAWVPFAIVWFGVGETPKAFIISIGVFMPVWLNTHIGVMATPARYLEASANLGVKGPALFLRVVFPAALPFIVAGVRQGLALAFVLLVAAELTGASHDLGHLISVSHMAFRTDRMMVGLLLLGVLGATADYLFNRLARRLIHWD